MKVYINSIDSDNHAFFFRTHNKQYQNILFIDPHALLMNRTPLNTNYNYNKFHNALCAIFVFNCTT